MRQITEIVVHCTATRPEWWANRTLAQKVAEVALWHTRDRGWKAIGYHWLIDRDGKVAAGRPEAEIGAHVAGHNARTIGVALFGGHGSAETDPFEANFTPAQDAALRRLLAEIKARHPGIARISGHNEHAAKACPGFQVRKWLAQVPPAPAAPAPASGLLAWFLSLFRRT